MAGNKFFAADDARIRKLAGSVPEPIASAEFKVSVTLLFENLVLNDLDVPLHRLVYRSGFIDTSAVPSDPQLCIKARPSTIPLFFLPKKAHIDFRSFSWLFNHR